MQKGQIWTVNFDPQVGQEIGKLRPAVIMSSDLVGILHLRIVAPITSWQDRYSLAPWMVRVEPHAHNNLKSPSAIDAFQMRSISQQRFKQQIGMITPTESALLDQAILHVFHLERLLSAL